MNETNEIVVILGLMLPLPGAGAHSTRQAVRLRSAVAQL
jgi:hypothetical protein